MRYFGMKDIRKIREMTLYEYDLRMKAHNLREVDREKRIHLQAWANWNVQATKRQGKKLVPVFKNFKQFFDYEKELKRIQNPGRAGNARQGVIDCMKRQRERRKTGGKL